MRAYAHDKLGRKMSDTVLTIVVSIITSGIFAAILSSYFDRKKQDKQLRLERLERAIVMVRKDFEEFQQAYKVFERSPKIKKPKWEPTQNPTDLYVTVVIGARHLVAMTTRYNEMRQRITFNMDIHPYSEKPKEQANTDLSVLMAELGHAHDQIVGDLMMRCARIMGIRVPQEKKTLHQRWAKLSDRIWSIYIGEK
jgi:hypothetical protein